MAEGKRCAASNALRGLQKALPRSDLPGARQPTPLNLNRYVLLFLYVFQTFMTGCVYFGWAPLSSMLFKAGIFSYKCKRGPDGKFVDNQLLHGRPYICDEQDASVQSLFALTLAMHCTMSALAGTMMDILGPKITSMIGQCFHIIGWSLISTLTPNSTAAVYLGFIFIGLGADTAFLPTLLVTRLFPGAAATVITVIGSASSASFAIPLILNSYFTNNGISGCWWYVGFGPCAFLVIDAVVMPLKPFKVFEGDLAEERQNTSRAEVPGPETPHFIHQDTDVTEQGPSSGVKDGQASGSPVEAAADRTFMKTLFSEAYVLVVVYFIAVGWITCFYQEAHDRILVQEAQHFLGTTLPFSFVFCVLLGKLSELIGILSVMAIVNTSGVLAYSFSLKQTVTTGYISVFWFMVYMSLFVSQVFVYVEQTFSAQYFGRLIGLVQLVGGLLSLLISPLYRLTLGLGPKGMYLVQLPMIGLLVVMYLVLFRMWCIRKKRAALLKAERDRAAPTGCVTPEP